ncbi:hypothetical protein [Sandaracinobacteroides saxicola]|uniref:Uncharacterized protein n=1 Tax=Sandaracinobacteroides saxicola TaxID=2759707 RepID=A0A7G5ILW0_9SPHN|nr:hypothetical protein [Sandaracinobacteroides saxicola]QMW24352.1 hypothetical protein H3309_07840 [Sandaracinobacteroides saxicola]
MKLLFPLAALLLFAGCEKSDTGHSSVTVDAKDGLRINASENGKTVAVAIAGDTAESSMKVAVDLPAVAPAYPGATVTKTETEAKDGKMKTELTMITSDPPAKVAAFYDGRFKAAGITPMVSATTDDEIARVVIANKGRTSVALGIEARDGSTRIKLAHTTKAG